MRRHQRHPAWVESASDPTCIRVFPTGGRGIRHARGGAAASCKFEDRLMPGPKHSAPSSMDRHE